jgi:hypothetical protein
MDEDEFVIEEGSVIEVLARVFLHTFRGRLLMDWPRNVVGGGFIAHWGNKPRTHCRRLAWLRLSGYTFTMSVSLYAEMNEYEQALDSLKQCTFLRAIPRGKNTSCVRANEFRRLTISFLGR